MCKIFLSLFFLGLSIPLFSQKQKPQKMVFNLLKFTEKVDFCDSNYKYAFQILPNINYTLRNKIDKSQKKGLEKQLTNKKIEIDHLFLEPNDWVTIYEVTYKICKPKNIKKIAVIKTKENSASHLDALIKKKVHLTFIERYYVSHKILKGPFQPYTLDNEDEFFKRMIRQISSEILKWLKTDEKENLLKQYNRSVAIGVRG